MARNAPVHSQQSISIQAPLKMVWSLITEIERWPERFPHVAIATINGDFSPGSQFCWKSGGVKIVSTLQDVEPWETVSWTGRAIGTQAVHEWTMRQNGDFVLLETRESFDGWLVRLMPGTMQAMLDKTLRTWLETIKILAESAKT